MNKPFLGRTPTDGFPYYCEICHASFEEYYMCDDFDCKLESIDVAKERVDNQGRNESNML